MTFVRFPFWLPLDDQPFIVVRSGGQERTGSSVGGGCVSADQEAAALCAHDPHTAFEVVLALQLERFVCLDQLVTVAAEPPMTVCEGCRLNAVILPGSARRAARSP